MLGWTTRWRGRTAKEEVESERVSKSLEDPFAWTRPDRLPRAYFTKRLAAMLTAVDSNPERTFQFNDAFKWEDPRILEARVRLKRVWVYGSFARGAETCGDLDVDIEVDYLPVGADDLRRPPQHLVGRAFWGNQRRVSVSVAMDASVKLTAIGKRIHRERVLVWEAGLDWRKRVEGISSSHTAGRHARLLGLLPFSKDRLRLSSVEATDLALAMKHLVLVSHCRPIDGGGEVARLRKDEAWALEALGRLRGRQANVAAASVLPVCRQLEMEQGAPPPCWTYGLETVVWCGHELHLGTADFGVRVLDRRPELVGFVMVPFLTARGPNGAWFVSRGPAFNSARSAMEAEARELQLAEGF